MEIETIAERDRRVDALEAGIRSLPVVEMDVVNHFSPGVYARELHIPAGTVLTGKVHKHENLNILSAGEISLFLEDGTTQRISAPFTVVSPAGTRRAAYAHTDCVWTTIHGTTERDIDKIEALFVCQTPAEYQQFLEQQTSLESDMIKNEVAA